MPARHRVVAAFRACAVGVAAAVLLGACSGDGNGFAGSSRSACSLIERLGSTAETLERADVRDPEEFDAALDDAVTQYTAVIDSLLQQTPDDLHDDLRALRAAAEQYRFGDAVAARAALDDYAESECGLRAVVTTATDPATPTTVAAAGG